MSTLWLCYYFMCKGTTFQAKNKKKARKVWSFTKKYVILHPETHGVKQIKTKHSYEKNIPTL